MPGQGERIAAVATYGANPSNSHNSIAQHFAAGWDAGASSAAAEMHSLKAQLAAANAAIAAVRETLTALSIGPEPAPPLDSSTPEWLAYTRRIEQRRINVAGNALRNILKG